ncbi:MAG: right-handed parallel beta-helix repeat-containing protein [Phycisphaerales bacterium]|nr:right-handed parallel beta-helix repeat-containing protein [Phycisphaerales bacterium]
MRSLMLAVLCIVPPAAIADEMLVDSLAALRAAAKAARAGDRILLAPGVYEGSVHIDGLRGEEARPVVIAGADRDNPPVIRGGVTALHLSRPGWVMVEDLIVEGASGNGLNIDDGGELEKPAEGVVVRRVVAREIGPEGNCDGIKLSGLAGFRIEACRIEQWGSGGSGIDMVGCRDGVIERCTLAHGDTAGGSGIQMKGGSRDIAVRSCRFEHAGRRAINIGGSTGLAFFRPRPGTSEAAAITVEGCTIIGSEAAVAFVGVDGADVRFNTIYHPRRWVMRILQETRGPGFVPCRGGRFTDNLVVFDIPEAQQPNIGDATDPASFVFARNVWYCDSDPARSEPRLPSVEEGGVYGVDPKLRDAERGDLTPAEGGVGAGVGAMGR